jgi:hypothetical protein
MSEELEWYAEREGRPLALLTDPIVTDMFWCSWKVAPLGTTTEDIDRVFTAAFWEPPGLVFRHRRTGEVAPHAFSAQATVKHPPTPESPWVSMRALYRPPWAMEPWLERALERLGWIFEWLNRVWDRWRSRR